MEKVYKARFPGRKRMRLPGYDYSSDGLYFVTIDCHNRECRFGHIHRGKMTLNDFGKIAEEEWLSLPLRFPQVKLGVFQIMPDHMHAIIEWRNNCVQVGLAPTDGINPGDELKSLSAIIGAYKSLAAVACIRCHKKKHSQENQTPVLGKIWKRGYYDRIIRDETTLYVKSRYIRNNPLRWTMN